MKKKGRKIQIDIVGAAGGIGLLNFSWWSESSFTKGFYRQFQNYCEEKGLAIEEFA